MPQLVDEQFASAACAKNPALRGFPPPFALYFDFIESSLGRRGCFFLAAALEMDDPPGLDTRSGDVDVASWGRHAMDR